MFRSLKSRVFYGWWMVGAGFGIQLLTGGLMNQAYGAYVVLLRDEFGWSKTMLSAGFSMARFETGLLGPVEGWLVDKFGPRTVMRCGLIIFALGFMALSQINSLTTFYLAFFMMALGSSLGGFLPLTVAMVNWFRRRRATALATMQTGMAVGGLCIPIVVLALETFGWRTTAFASGVLVLIVALPLSQIIRHRPEDHGLEVDGGYNEALARRNGDREEDEPIDFLPREAVRTPAFWLISLGHGSALLVVSAVMVHLVSHVNENLGYSLTTAGLVVALMTSMQIIGQVTGGLIGDRFNKRLIAAACMGAHMAGLLLVAYATMLPMVIAFAVLHGLAWGIRGPLMQALRADYFGRASFGVIMGLSTMITMFGNITGPLVAGILADVTGSYEIGFTVLACLAGAGSMFFLLARKPQPPARVLAMMGGPEAAPPAEAVAARRE
ncbi:MAG: MFS transporter [Dehalococcoidia bacterium]|nr:MFS transporter [Dehalococcoidia bacterium]